MDAAEWRIPAIETKTGKHLQAHAVPLSPQALALLPGLRELSGHTDRLFPSGGNAGGVISENTIKGTPVTTRFFVAFCDADLRAALHQLQTSGKCARILARRAGVLLPARAHISTQS